MLRVLSLFFKLSFRNQSLILGTIILSVYCYFLFKIKPNWIRFGRIHQVKLESGKIDWGLVKDIRESIRLVSKRLPLHLVCRHEAYMAKIWLNYYKIPFKIYIGFKYGDDKSILGHAWTEVQGRQITGFCDPQDYVIQAIYT
ncbi:lasso peptide biosynthesis B2 protein [Aquirufa ecclesiirivi]|uniref:lasso peptide biosynthesis B2 protein n=1 Tax=Aquirufa ecclesiirivi TaxID=2715124 RepID=UPI0022A8CEAC|nr:lasso peptide biosynthesis B2 protein [Aquirufa ecclesiirivi]